MTFGIRKYYGSLESLRITGDPSKPSLCPPHVIWYRNLEKSKNGKTLKIMNMTPQGQLHKQTVSITPAVLQTIIGLWVV